MRMRVFNNLPVYNYDKHNCICFIVQGENAMFSVKGWETGMQVIYRICWKCIVNLHMGDNDNVIDEPIYTVCLILSLYIHVCQIYKWIDVCSYKQLHTYCISCYISGDQQCIFIDVCLFCYTAKQMSHHVLLCLYMPPTFSGKL